MEAHNHTKHVSLAKLETQCRRAYIYNPPVAAFLIREGRVSEDLSKMRAFYAALD